MYHNQTTIEGNHFMVTKKVNILKIRCIIIPQPFKVMILWQQDKLNILSEDQVAKMLISHN